MNKIDQPALAAYDDDFALWSVQQAALVRTGKFERLDRDNVAEELESLLRAEQRHIERFLGTLLTNLLKWDKQPGERSGNWQSGIRGWRNALRDVLDESPSLSSYPGEVLEEVYGRAREKASEETTVFLHLFPETCPYTIEQILDLDFLPESPDPGPANRKRALNLED